MAQEQFGLFQPLSQNIETQKSEYRYLDMFKNFSTSVKIAILPPTISENDKYDSSPSLIHLWDGPSLLNLPALHA